LAQLGAHLSETAEVILFLLGAMTIVELINAHRGFDALERNMPKAGARGLLWLLSIAAFFLSAVLDNMTTTIVMVSVMRSLVADGEQRLYMTGLIVIAANAGGAWSPIGDVTTTMLWIGGRVSALGLVSRDMLPAAVSLLAPLAIVSLRAAPMAVSVRRGESGVTEPFHGATIVLIAGLSALPPYLAILLGLGAVWALTDVLHRKDKQTQLRVTGALAHIDVSSILFFLGILLAVGALESAGLLAAAASWLGGHLPGVSWIVAAIGLLSAAVDNVPLTAALMGMYAPAAYPADAPIWTLTAYCVGTGGSILIVGSAAGVVAMGMEKITFLWYLRRIAPLALAGYLAGLLALLALGG
jgi:Na+/H+ antiporter NhaD/arsenite permease-like protein